jgi:hypothetical protein
MIYLIAGNNLYSIISFSTLLIILERNMIFEIQLFNPKALNLL